jgi:glycerol-1-phosphate dehydrogenase [NAD(P)+]
MKQRGDFSGVIGELVAGRWYDPHTGVKQTIPVESIVIADTLDGSEAELCSPGPPGQVALCSQ